MDADDFFIRAEFRGNVGNVGGQDNDTLRGGMGGKQGQDGGEDVFFHNVSVWFAGFWGRLKTQNGVSDEVWVKKDYSPYFWRTSAINARHASDSASASAGLPKSCNTKLRLSS